MEDTPDLGQVLISLMEVFPLFGYLLIMLIALGGLWIGYMGMYELWRLSSERSRMSYAQSSAMGGIGKLVLGAVMVIFPIIFVRAANTFVLGGEETFNMFSYVPSGGTNYCQDLKHAITYFFMVVGIVAWAFGFSILYSKTNGDQSRMGTPWIYFVGGILCFFLNDVAEILSNTTGMQIGLENICKAAKNY